MRFPAIAVLVLMFGCSSSPPGAANAPVARATVDTQISEISYELNVNWGVKDTDKITFHSNGSAEYLARLGYALVGFNRGPNRRGKFQGLIETKDFDQLSTLMVRRNFFSLKDKYVARGVADAETITTAVRYSAGLKTVANYGGGGDDEVGEIERSIVSIAKQIKWQRVEKSTAQ